MKHKFSALQEKTPIILTVSVGSTFEYLSIGVELSINFSSKILQVYEILDDC